MIFLPTTRVLWPQQFSADNQPVCVSDDGEMPLQDSERATQPQVIRCAECNYAQFGGDGTPPQCKAQRNFLVLCLPDYEPAILTMQSTAIGAAKQLTSLAKMCGLRKSIAMAARRVQDNRGSWFVPVFVVGRKLDDGEILVAVDFRNDLRNLVITADVVQESGTGPEIEELEEVPF